MHPALELQLKSFVSKKIGKDLSTVSSMRMRYFNLMYINIIAQKQNRHCLLKGIVKK